MWPRLLAPAPDCLFVPLPKLYVQASDNSTPCSEVSSRREKDDTEHQNASRSPLLHASRSIGLSDSRVTGALVKAVLSDVFDLLPKVLVWHPGGASLVIPPLQLFCMCLSNAPQSLRKHPQGELPLADLDPSAGAKQPVVFVIPVLVMFLLVSYILYRNPAFASLAIQSSIMLKRVVYPLCQSSCRV